jgi:O-Antigen ligase
MRRAVLVTAAAVLLVGPTVLAFFSGGYFDEPRLVATLVAWVVVLLVALVGSQPLPASAPGRLAAGGLAFIAAWSGLSIAWAPLSEAASDNFVRVLLYLGALLAAAALLRRREASWAVEPVLALGVLLVICYGLSERLVPGIVDLSASGTAFGRLEQPITYWNAEGALAAVGLMLCARLAGTSSRAPVVRILAAASCVPLGTGVYLSYSRGAIAAALVGLLVLLATAPSRPQLRACAAALIASVIASVACSRLPGVSSLEGTLDARQRDGAIALGVLVVLMLAAAFLQARWTKAEPRGPVSPGRVAFARRLPKLAAVAVAASLGVLVVVGLSERGSADEPEPSEGASRLTSVESRRYDYWRVGLDAFLAHPVAGLGAGGFRVEWLRERPVSEKALEVHSLPLEMAAELGIVGLLGLGFLVVGVGVAARRALRRHPALAPGACVGVTVWSVHAAIDWDWQLPAVTLPAVVMAGLLVALSETPVEWAEQL